MAPFARPIRTLGNKTIRKGNSARKYQGPAQRLLGPCEGGRVDGESHKDVAHAIDRHQTIDDLSVIYADGRFVVLEVGEGIGGAEDCVDAKCYEDCGEGIGDVGERGELGEGCHFDVEVGNGRLMRWDLLARVSTC